MSIVQQVEATERARAERDWWRTPSLWYLTDDGPDPSEYADLDEVRR